LEIIAMEQDRLTETEHALVEVGILVDLLTSAYHLSTTNHEECIADYDASIEVVLPGLETRMLRTAIQAPELREKAQGSKSKIIGINGDDWYVTSVNGSNAFIEALSAVAERLGAKRIAA
jgi:hypothetical protein